MYKARADLNKFAFLLRIIIIFHFYDQQITVNKMSTKTIDPKQDSSKLQQGQNKHNASSTPAKEANKENVPITSTNHAQVSASSTLNGGFSFGQQTALPKDALPRATTMPPTAKEPFSFSQTKNTTTNKNQNNSSGFSFGAAPSTPFGQSSGFAGFGTPASPSTLFSSKPLAAANSSSSPEARNSKDLLHAYIEAMVKSQVKEEIKRLLKEGEWNEELHKIVKEELRTLIGNAVKNL